MFFTPQDPRGRFPLLPALLGWALLAAGCQGEPETAPVPNRPPVQAEVPPPGYRIIDYKDRDREAAVPPWLEAYLAEGNRGVEALPEFANSYVFVAENRGLNLPALSTWAGNFSLPQDFPRLAALRIEARLFRDAPYYPDDVYGAFFEMAVKAAWDGYYLGMVRRDECWIRRQFVDPAGPVIDGGNYEFFILITVDKSLLEPQVHDILNAVHPAPSPRGEQAAAIDRVKTAFFDGF